MFMSWPLLIYLLFATLLIGSVVGVAETALLYRSQLTARAFLKGVVFGAIGFLAGSFLAGWGDEHPYFLNGKRMDRAPWGENLWLRNRLAENGILLSLLLAFIPILIGYAIARRFSIAHRDGR